MRPVAQEYLLQIPLWTRKKNTLEQVRDFLTELGDPEQAFPVIHVAGTNGKGSVCADLTAMLVCGGYHVGTFISPHLVDIRERFLLDGRMVEQEAFQASFDQVYDLVQRMLARGYCHPTFFEFLFLMAMVLFAGEKSDYVILETGLGGRLDTTNVIRHPAAAVITSISLDHMKYLGDTIPLIAGEKAGIIKPAIPVIYDDNCPEASEVIRSHADRLGAPAYPVTERESCREVVFAAPYQAMNAALAVKTLEVLNVPDMSREVIREGLQTVKWPGRMEQAGEDIWLDGAHNPGGIQAFLRAAGEIEKKNPRNVHFLFAAVADKDYNEMIQTLCDALHPSCVTVARLESERSLEQDVLTNAFLRAGCGCVTGFSDTGEALDCALAHKSGADRLYIVGSLYLIGEIKEHLRRRGYAGLRRGNQPF